MVDWFSQHLSYVMWLRLYVLQCQTLIDELSAAHSTDLQQRAYELQALLHLDSRAVESVMPVDASCEDIEVGCQLL